MQNASMGVEICFSQDGYTPSALQKSSSGLCAYVWMLKSMLVISIILQFETNVGSHSISCPVYGCLPCSIFSGIVLISMPCKLLSNY